MQLRIGRLRVGRLGSSSYMGVWGGRAKGKEKKNWTSLFRIRNYLFTHWLKWNAQIYIFTPFFTVGEENGEKLKIAYDF